MASSTTKETYEVTPQDVADILAGTLEYLQGKGLRVGVRNAPATDKRPYGLMIFIAGLTTDDEGAIFAGRDPVPQNGELEPA